MMHELHSSDAGCVSRARNRDTPSEGCRVLVVEDHPDGRATLCFLLQLHGFQVEEAADRLEGVRKALRWQPDVAIVGIGLPGIKGFEVALQVMAVLGWRIRLVARTAYGSEKNKERAFAVGFDEQVTTPADIVELERRLRTAIQEMANNQRLQVAAAARP
jgi:CheY-like chemotaxis protein